MSVRSLLTMECRIERWATREPNSLGVVGPATWAAVVSGVPCLVQQHGARLLRSAQGVEITYNATGFFLIGTDLRAKVGQTKLNDRIVVTRNGSGTYHVRGVVDEAGKQAMLTVALEAM